MKPRTPKQTELVSLLSDYAQKRQRSFELMVEAVRDNDPRKAQRAAEFGAAADAVLKQLNR